MPVIRGSTLGPAVIKSARPGLGRKQRGLGTVGRCGVTHRPTSAVQPAEPCLHGGIYTRTALLWLQTGLLLGNLSSNTTITLQEITILHSLNYDSLTAASPRHGFGKGRPATAAATGTCHFFNQLLGVNGLPETQKNLQF